jgi:hypothetical protein
VVVDNPTQDPQLWQTRFIPLMSGTAGVGGSVVSGSYVYFFVNHLDVALVRLPLSALDAATDLRPHVEWFVGTGQWATNVAYEKASRFTNIHANSGSTPRYNQRLKKWQILYWETSQFPLGYVALSTADAITGPWSNPVKLYTPPESGVDGNFCYGAYEHPAYVADPDKQIAFTYTCNNMTSSKVLNNMSIYVPKFIRLAHPQ